MGAVPAPARARPGRGGRAVLILGLGTVVILVVLGALRFARMEVDKERATFAREKTKDVIFEGTLTPRTAREGVAATLETGYLGERIRITVQRLPEGTAGRPPEGSTPPVQ